uniref:Uncharacterized protein n=1 Tax=Oryza punctata TaxID=4537 RepID=A0A0E0LDL3_ORYPU
MIEGMELYTPKEGVVADDFALSASVDGDKEVNGKMIVGRKMDLMQILVLSNLGQLVLLFVALCVMFLK